MSLTKGLVIIAGAALGLTGNALAQSSLDQSRAYQNELLADAQGRTSLLQPGGSGWDAKNGFTLGSADGNYRLNIGYWNQFRYTINVRDNVPSPGEDFTSGFSFVNNRVELTGNAITQALTYKLSWDFATGDATLKDAYAKYQFDNGWSLKWGQYKLPFLKEYSISDNQLQAASFSVMTNAFNQGRSQGVELGYESEEFRFAADFSDGVRAANTDWDSQAEADYGFTGRFDWKFGGAWEQFTRQTSWQNSEFGGYVGVAGNYQDGGSTGASTVAGSAIGNTSTIDVTNWALTVDSQIVGNGWNAFAAFVWANTDPAAGNSFDDFGFQIQGGFFVTSQWELFGRYDITLPDDSRAANVDNFNVITVGANYYFVERSQAAKFTADLQWCLDAQSNTGGLVVPSTYTSVMADTEENQLAIRLQFQLMF